MKKLVFLTAIVLTSCAPSGGGRHAMVDLRDGTEVSGTITSSSATELQLTADDKSTRTIPMTMVKSIEYDDAAPATATSGTAAPAPGAPSAPAPVRERAHRDHYHPSEAAVTTKTSVVAAGTQISVRVEETIDSAKAVEGQTFPSELTQDVLDSEGSVVIPRGSNATIVIRSAAKGGRIKGQSDLVLDLASVTIEGRIYDISTTDVVEKGRSGMGVNRRTGEFTGGGAAIGAIIGAIAGGGKGAAIGAGSGAGAGALTQILTKGGSIKVPVESVLTFKLDQPLRVRAAS